MTQRLKVGEREREFLRTRYRGFYYRNLDKLWMPRSLPEREIGFLTFGYTYRRHLSFTDDAEFKATILRETPWGIFYSISYYDDPGNTVMERKGWKGADLVFDIDIKDLEPPCLKEHDFLLCDDQVLPYTGAGDLPGDGGCKKVDWICPLCIDDGKDGVLKLLDVLTRDFGISPGDIQVYYSGHRGFHVHIEDGELVSLDRRSRPQITEYLTLSGVDPKSIWRLLPLAEGEMNSLMGWPKRIVERASQVLNRPMTLPLANVLRKAKRFNSLMDGVIDDLRISIDPQVTQDISRIFRLPTSLNEKTGLRKTRCDDIMSCDPLVESVVFDDDPVKLHVTYAPKLDLGGYTYGPYRKTTVRLPTFVAVFLVSKGLAKLAI